MDKHLQIWKDLYEVTQEWIDLKAWTKIYSDDFVAIEYPDDTYYCTIMGKMGDCIGLSVYQGDEGYADLLSISHDFSDHYLVSYMMFEQRCITFYMGNRDEVPSQQKALIKELGLKFRGRGNWPYFLSFRPQFYPYHISDDEAIIMTKVIRQLTEIMKAYMANQIDVLYDKNEMIFAYQDNSQWIYEARSYPKSSEKFPFVQLEDKEYVHSLKLKQATKDHYLMDVCYLGGSIKDKRYDRPVNALIYILLDEDLGFITDMELIEPENDEIEYCIRKFCMLIEKQGRPETLTIRNPMIYSALAALCDDLDVTLHIHPIPEMDEIIDEFAYRML